MKRRAGDNATVLCNDGEALKVFCNLLVGAVSENPLLLQRPYELKNARQVMVLRGNYLFVLIRGNQRTRTVMRIKLLD